MLYHNDTTLTGASPVSVFGDLVDEVKLREAVELAPELLQQHSDADVLASFAHLQRLTRFVDAITLRIFQEISSRSPDTGPSLARDHGHKDAIDLLVRLTGSSRPDVRARLELAAVLPTAQPSWADSPDPSSDPTSPDASGDLPPPGDGADPSDSTGSGSPDTVSREPLFSYVEKGIRSGELPEKTAIRITQEIRKFQRETTNTTPEQILHAEKLLVAYAIGAEIPENAAEDFVLDFDFGAGPDASDASDSSDGSDTTPPVPARPVRPNLPLPSTGVGRAATNVLKKIAPTSKRVEKAQTARRCVKIGPTVRGLVQITGWVLPEVAALIQRAFDVLLSPRTTQTEDLGKTGSTSTSTSTSTSASASDGSTGAFGETGTRVNNTSGTTGSGVRFTKTSGASANRDANTELTITDDRTPDQKRHDAFAALMEAALKAGHLPQTANGAATLVITISEEELDKPDGTGRMIDHFGKETPVTARTARHTACNGKVMLMRHTRKGRIVELQNLQRVFTEHQRRAIIARDGGCVIPGCEVPAGWCEIHHVIPWTEQQVTDVSNGVALCWWHHRNIETSGWDIRMRDGVPEIKAPPGIDPEQLWRPARPRVLEHAIMLNTGNRENGGNHENRETEKHQPGEPFDWGAILTEEPF